MKNNIDIEHPYIRQLGAIAEQDVIVIDNVTGMPIYGEPFIASDMLIMICHQGMTWNKGMPVPTFSAHDVGILLPDQIVITQRASTDYHTGMSPSEYRKNNNS